MLGCVGVAKIVKGCQYDGSCLFTLRYMLLLFFVK